MPRDAAAVMRDLKRDHPGLAEKVQLATGPAEQLNLFPSPTPPGRAAVSLSLKSHDWDVRRPVSKSRFDLVLRCKRCGSYIRSSKGGQPMFSPPTRPDDGPKFFRWSSLRPPCGPKESDHG